LRGFTTNSPTLAGDNRHDKENAHLPIFLPSKMKKENQSLKRLDLLGWTEIPTVIEIGPQVERFNYGKKRMTKGQVQQVMKIS
jgi:hypothetical protein